MEIAIIIMLAVAIVLLVLVLLKVSAKDDSRTYVKESEERILNGIANVSDSQNRSFSD